MSNYIRWGILGTGVIAGKFAVDLPSSEAGRLVAVGSRSQSSADKFAQSHGGNGYGSYAALLADPEVDAVYNSLPNGMHHDWTLKALRAGKHVLCEKPFAANLPQAEEMFQVAEQCGKVLIEAFMYRCRPLIRQLIATVRSGAIGEVRIIRSNFTFSRAELDSDARYHPELAGGSLMDVGCYCLNLTRALVGAEPTEIRAIAHRHRSGVDDYAVGMLRFGDSVFATFTCGMNVHSDLGTYIGGSKGYITLSNPWTGDEPFYWVKEDGTAETIRINNGKPLYALEADAFAGAVRASAEPWLTKTDSLGNMRLLDELRTQVGIAIEA